MCLCCVRLSWPCVLCWHQCCLRLLSHRVVVNGSLVRSASFASWCQGCVCMDQLSCWVILSSSLPLSWYCWQPDPRLSIWLSRGTASQGNSWTSPNYCIASVDRDALSGNSSLFGSFQVHCSCETPTSFRTHRSSYFLRCLHSIWVSTACCR